MENQLELRVPEIELAKEDAVMKVPERMEEWIFSIKDDIRKMALKQKDLFNMINANASRDTQMYSNIFALLRSLSDVSVATSGIVRKILAGDNDLSIAVEKKKRNSNKRRSAAECKKDDEVIFELLKDGRICCNQFIMRELTKVIGRRFSPEMLQKSMGRLMGKGIVTRFSKGSYCIKVVEDDV